MSNQKEWMNKHYLHLWEDVEIEQLPNEKFYDSTWHNDAMPSIANDFVQMWINYPKGSARDEFSDCDGFGKYGVKLVCTYGSGAGELYHGDDAKEACAVFDEITRLMGYEYQKRRNANKAAAEKYLKEAPQFTGGDEVQALKFIWHCLDDYVENSWQHDDGVNEEITDEINTAMSWIMDAMGVEHDQI